jgi:ribulose 1,5-bisphosphate synthetase/thiazole synthase
MSLYLFLIYSKMSRDNFKQTLSQTFVILPSMKNFTLHSHYDVIIIGTGPSGQ